jgi:hypothetical protein
VQAVLFVHQSQVLQLAGIQPALRSAGESAKRSAAQIHRLCFEWM